MKRCLAFFALVMIAGAAAFAQTRESVRIYVQSGADNPMHEVFFRESFAAEIEAAGYSLAYRAAASDYILNLVARPNVILYDDGTRVQAPSNEKQFLLQFTLVRNRDNAEIVAFSFPFTDPIEVESYSSYLFYQIMTYLPYFFPEYTPPVQADVPRETPVLGDTLIIRNVPGQVSAEELARIQAEALEQARQEARREEQERQAAQAQALREEQERQAAQAKALEEARQAARAEALEQARQERTREEELARQEQAREEERARQEARVRELEEALKEAQAAGIREIPIPYEVEVYRDREVTREVPVPVPVPGETVIIKEPAAAEPDLWRNKKMYLRASADVPFTYFQIRPDQLLSNDEFRIVPGATVGLELHFDNWISVEFDFFARFSDLWGYTVNPGLGFQLKFPLKPAVYLMLEPYLGAAFSLNMETHSNTRYYLEAGGGFQFGFKGGQSGAWFFDVNFMHTFNNILNGFIPQISVISTNTPEIRWNRFVIGLGVGYKLGFMDR